MHACKQAGAIAPLVALLRDAATGEVAAELAAVVLRNLALGNAGNRDAIVDAGGLAPLLGLLSAGQEWLTQPMPCEVGMMCATRGPPYQTPTRTLNQEANPFPQ